MKKITILILLTIPLLFSCKNKEENATNGKYAPKPATKQEVIEIAKRYGFTRPISDDFSAFQKFNGFYMLDSIEKQPLYLVQGTEYFEEYYKNMNFQARWYNECLALDEGRKTKVHSMKDYLDLLNSLPLLRAADVKEHGGEEGYKKYQDSLLAKSYHIYYDDNAKSIKFLQPQNDEGGHKGRRLDIIK